MIATWWGSDLHRASTRSRSLDSAMNLLMRASSRSSASRLWRPISPRAHPSQVQVSDPARSPGKTPSARQKDPLAVSRSTARRSKRSNPAYARRATVEGRADAGAYHAVSGGIFPFRVVRYLIKS